MLLSSAVAQFIASREHKNCTPGTLRNYKSQLILLCDWFAVREKYSLEAITLADLEAYVCELHTRSQLRRAGRLSPVTIFQRVRGLQTFFAWAVECGWRSDNPAARLKFARAKRLPRVIGPDDLRKLLDAPTCARDRAVLFLFLDTGLRLAELAALELGDVDLSQGLAHVRHGKGDKERYTVFTARTGEALLAYLQERTADQHPELFLSLAGSPIKPGGIYKLVKRLARAAGMYAEVSPHRLRHTFATLFLNNGGKIHVAQKLLGHESITTTMRYLDVSLADLQQEHSRYSPLKG